LVAQDRSVGSAIEMEEGAMQQSFSTSPVARRLVAISLGSILALTGAAVTSGQPAHAGARAGLGCGQLAQAGRLFNSYNQCTTLNSAKPALVTLAKPAHITQIADYHFNNGVAVKPGTIGLMAANGHVFGPYRATKQTGTWDWITAVINLTVPAGTYSVVDSSPATWSQNSFSGGRGFTRVFGAFVASAPAVPAPAPAPAATHATCAASAPSSFLVSPSHVAKGATVSFLLSCQKAVSLGFKGSFAPLKVLIYDEGSYRNLKFVNGYLRPISASLPVRPPVVVGFTVVGPNDVDVTLPASMPNGTYIVVIEYAKGEVPSANSLVVP
jgi:hypothetical protein